LKELPGVELSTHEKLVEITGDLCQYLEDNAGKTEKLPMVYVTRKETDGAGNIAPGSDRNSPVLLIGDSHTLVFNDGGDLHTRGAGLADHLAIELGTAIDHIGVRGSGTTVPRITLARRRDNLKGKKLVIWCFSSRQFTESSNGWMTGLPVVR
jgi:alginate O-acetyltransferase complex protein AlgJ